MSIFSRLSDIVNANLTTLLDRAEDPEKMARLMIQEMEDTLVEIRSAAVKAIADRKELERRLADARFGSEDWERKAELAVAKGKEDLARAALLEKRRSSDRVRALESELVQVDEVLGRYEDDIGRLQSKLDEAKAKRKSLELRAEAAGHSIKARRVLHDARVDEALARYDRMHRRIDELEGEAEILDKGRPKGLAERFAELESEGNVEAELDALRRKVKSGS
ncbi:MAG: phage shock protein PspA [Alphaproteobacteria bacterium]|nr:phage shock protein PspA [Alphaproteobacteria bacterium]